MENGNETDFKNFGKQVKKFRKMKELTQEALAFDCEVSKRTIQRIEKGEINITMNIMFLLAKALEVKTSDLFEE